MSKTTSTHKNGNKTRKKTIRDEELNVKTSRQILTINLTESGLLKSKKMSTISLMDGWVLFVRCSCFLLLVTYTIHSIVQMTM